MTTPEKIASRLRETLGAVEVDIQDLSEKHAGHPGATSGGGHYRVRIVSGAFQEKDLLARHRMVYDAMSGMIGGEIHALSLETLTPDEV